MQESFHYCTRKSANFFRQIRNFFLQIVDWLHFQDVSVRFTVMDQDRHIGAREVGRAVVSLKEAKQTILVRINAVTFGVRYLKKKKDNLKIPSRNVFWKHFCLTNFKNKLLFWKTFSFFLYKFRANNQNVVSLLYRQWKLNFLWIAQL